MQARRQQVLVVEDEDAIRGSLIEVLQMEGFEADEAATGDEALERLSSSVYDVLVTDYALPGKNGLELLEEALVRFPDIVAIVITGHGSIEGAVEAMKKGAYSYLTKPFKLIELPMMVRKGLNEKRLQFENQYLRNQLREKYSFSNIIGTGPKMKSIFELIETVAALPSTVLIQGETGTGKELIAKAIHFNSPRKDQKMISLNTAAIPENLLESELFGHVKGAFTGAIQTRVGKFEQADGGTLFLDEIGSMPLSLQVKLLRVLQEREIERIGGNTTIKVDVRIIAATSSDLEQMVKQGSFREDLYYRLNVIPIQLPPLRERREDIPFLIRAFAERFCEQHGLEKKSFSADVLRMLFAYDWKGNVRQLENTIERMVALSGKRTAIDVSDVPQQIALESNPSVTPFINIPEAGINLQTVVTGIERELILQSLRKTNGNKKLAAKLLQIKRTTLIEKIKRIQVEVPMQVIVKSNKL